MQTSLSPLWKRGNAVEPSSARGVVLRAVRRGDRFADEPDPALLAVGTPDVLACARDLLREDHAARDRWSTT